MLRSEDIATPVLLGEQRGRVRTLPGFQKGGRHHEPDDHFDAAVAFIQRIGNDLLERETEGLFRELREVLGLRRKEMEYRLSEGLGTIEIPLLTVEISLDQDEEESRLYVLRTLVRPQGEASKLLRPDILSILAGRVSQVIYALPGGLDLEATIDQLEESENLRECLDYRPDGSELTLRPPGGVLTLHLSQEKAVFSMAPGANLEELLTGMFDLWPRIRPGTDFTDQTSS